MRETENGKRETGNRKQGASQGERQNEKWEQKQRIENENTDRATVPTSFAGFSPTRPYGLSTGGRENMGTRLLGFKLGFVSVFHFPVPRFISMSKKSYLIIVFIRKLATGSRQLFLRYGTCFYLFIETIKIRNGWNYIL